MLRRIALPLYLIAPLLWLFRRALFAGELFAYRDSAYYYFPYYQYVNRRWQSGIPLWNPLDGLGQPLLGDPTAAVFYPGKLLFMLPMDYATCFALYIVAHLLLAGFATFKLARQLKSTVDGATLAAISYMLSGQVLFQYCNPIYLVGAAWLPIALTLFHRLVHQRRTALTFLAFSAVLCMMILGGDPQMAVHTILCGLIWVLLSLVSALRERGWAAVWTHAKTETYPLVAACVFAALLAAIQILPSQEWAAQSDRATTTEPHSIFEYAHQISAGQTPSLKGLWHRDTLRTTHERKTYDFSVGPWRWSELFWPNISGRFGPLPTRWIRGLPGEARIWSPSLYLGLLPLCLACARSRFMRGAPNIRWLSWLAILSAIAAMGEYGLGWLVDELRHSKTDPFQPSPLMRGTGGLYWLLSVSLPTYAQFRYPAKWWTITSLAISVLGAKGWPLLRATDRIRYRFIRSFAFASVGVLIAMLVCRFALVGDDVPASQAFGPFNNALSNQQIACAIVHSALVFVALAVLFRRRFSWQQRNRAILIGVAIELCIAQCSLIQTTPPMDAQQATSTDIHPILRSSGHCFPGQFSETTSPHRFEQMMRSDVESLMPKHHLTAGRRQLNSISSLQCAELTALLELSKGKQQPSTTASRSINSALGAAPNAPRAWLVQKWNAISPTPSIHERIDKALCEPDGQFRDLHLQAVIEAQETFPVSNPPSPRGAAEHQHRCKFVSQTAERYELQVETTSPSLLVLREQYYPGWSAKITTEAQSSKDTTVYRANACMRAIFVPVGKSTIVMQYHPRSFYWGLAISTVAWSCLIIAARYRYTTTAS